MKEFIVYTALRLLLFAAVLTVVLGLWVKLLGTGSALIWPLVLSFLISGGLSIVLLNGPRQAFAERVERRADKVASKFDELRRKED